MASPAPACRQALNDANKRWPSRNRASDGIMGDARHQATKSDHNLGNAVDVTHDPESGCDGDLIASLAIQDPRVTYVIWNKKIYNRSRAGEGWRKYTGTNPHTKHCHISVRATSRTDTRAWAWSSAAGAPAPQPSGGAPAPTGGSAAPTPGEKPPSGPAPTNGGPPFPGTSIKKGSQGMLVRRVQERLRATGWEVVADGKFGDETDRVVRSFQRRKGLLDDGVVGRKTWNALF